MPQDNFLVVPNEGVNLIWLDGSRGAVSFDHDRKLSVHAVRSDQVSKIAEQYVRQHTSGGVGIATVEDLRKQIWSRMFSIVDRLPGRLLAINGKAPGWSWLKVSAGGNTFKLDVAVTKRQWVDVSFRFLQHRVANGGTAPDTIYKPEDAAFFVATLNWIYGPQTNISFDLWDAEWVTLPDAPHQPVGRDVFVKSIATQAPSGPDITVFLVGKWGGGASGHSRGTFFDDLDVAAIDDAPKRDEIPEPIDVFMLTMAHEILHYIRKERGFAGHHDRQNVLLSNKIQSLRMDKQLVMDVNPP